MWHSKQGLSLHFGMQTAVCRSQEEGVWPHRNYIQNRLNLCHKTRDDVKLKKYIPTIEVEQTTILYDLRFSRR
jgi:hypothetical protein